MTDSKEVAVVDNADIVLMAKDPEISADKLERLAALKLKLMDVDARHQFLQALSAFQDQCPEIPKNKTAKIATQSGAGYGYTYAALEDITRVVNPILKAHGLSYAWTTEGMEGGILNVVFILRHLGGHEERSTFPVPPETKAAMSAAQKVGAAMTYGRRQSLVSGLGLTTADEDPDGADPGSTEQITDGQADYLKGLLKDGDADVARFLAVYQIASVEEMTIQDFGRAVRDIEERNAAKAQRED